MGKRTSMRTKRKAPQKKQLRGGTKLTEFIEWEKAYNDTRALYPEAIQAYREIMALSPEEQQRPEQRARHEANMRFFDAFRDIQEGFEESRKALVKEQRKDYKKRVKNEFKLSPEEREALKKDKPKPIRPLPSIPEVEERPTMERQDAVGMGKKIAFARKYLRGKGIRASQKNVRDIVTAMDVEGVVFES